MSANGQVELPSSRQRRVEAGLAAVQEVEQERDECREAFDNLQTEHRGLKAEHDALQMAYSRLQNDMATYRADRDEAVKRLAQFEAVYDAVLAVMQKHRAGTPSDAAATPKA